MNPIKVGTKAPIQDVIKHATNYLRQKGIPESEINSIIKYIVIRYKNDILESLYVNIAKKYLPEDSYYEDIYNEFMEFFEKKLEQAKNRSVK